MTTPQASTAPAAPLLQTHDLVRQFGGLTATDHVNLSIRPGARHALIGPNGAGKTTLVNQLTGALDPSSGRIVFDGDDITRLPLHRRAARGLARTFQINQLFNAFTPRETLLLAVSQRSGHGADWWRPLGSQEGQQAEVDKLLADFHLDDVADITTKLLPYGKRRLLEIAIALAARPRLLLLDEPVAGVPAGESREILETLAALPASITILLIEHDMDLVFRFADTISVLVNGALLTEGPPAQIAQDPQVRAAYLGNDHG